MSRRHKRIEFDLRLLFTVYISRSQPLDTQGSVKVQLGHFLLFSKWIKLGLTWLKSLLKFIYNGRIVAAEIKTNVLALTVFY